MGPGEWGGTCLAGRLGFNPSPTYAASPAAGVELAGPPLLIGSPTVDVARHGCCLGRAVPDRAPPSLSGFVTSLEPRQIQPRGRVAVSLVKPDGVLVSWQRTDDEVAGALLLQPLVQLLEQLGS
jgi:hypothetical protein